MIYFLLYFCVGAVAMRIGFLNGYNRGFNDAPAAIEFRREMIKLAIREHVRKTNDNK